MKKFLSGVVALSMTLGMLNITPLAENADLYAVGADSVIVYPSADIQFRKNNTTNYGTSKGLEVRHGTDVGDNGFVGGIKFDLTTVDTTNISAVTLELVTETRDNSGKFSIKPFSDDWSEDSKNLYSDKETEISEALNADAIAEFNAAFGGKKLFESTGISDEKRVLSNWTSQIDVTDYVLSQLDENDTTISMLITPQNFDNNKGATFLSKDISEESYGNADRWASILEAFSNEIDDTNLDLLKPRLVISYETEEPEITDEPEVTEEPQITDEPSDGEEVSDDNIYPLADIQFRLNNTNDYSKTNTFEVRKDADLNDAFLGGLKFDISEIDRELLKNVTLELVTETRDNSGKFQVKPFSDNWSEGSGNKYSDKQSEINDALSSDVIAEFSAAYGGKKLFESTSLNDEKRILENWTSKVDITDYVKSQLAQNDTILSILITPQNFDNAKGATFLTKDVSRDTYTVAERWDAIMEAFASEVSNENFSLLKPRLTVEYYAPEEVPRATRIVIDGERSVDLAKAELPIRLAYSAKVYDQYGNEMSYVPKWSYTTTAVSGKAEFDRKNATLTIPADATVQTVTISAEYGNAKNSIDVLIDELVPTTIEINGADSINNYISNIEKQYEYTAKVLDQNGQAMPEKKVKWEFTTDAEKNAAEFSNGIVTTPVNVSEQTIVIKAICENAVQTKTIKILKTILDLPESFAAQNSMKLRGFGNGDDIKVNSEYEEIGMKAAAPALLSFDLSKILDEASGVITEMSLVVRKESGTSIALGLWQYADPNDTIRTDGRSWIDCDWTDTSNKSSLCNNYSLIFGIDDFAAKHEVTAANYADGRTSYIPPIATATLDDSTYTFKIKGEVLENVIEQAKANNNIAELVVTSADLDARSSSLKLYMTGTANTNPQYMPTLSVSYDLPSTPRKVEIDGNDVLYINKQAGTYNSQYSATVYDQFGELYSEQDVVWSADLSEVTNVTFDADRGIVTISPDSSEGKIVISATNAYAVGTKTITIEQIPQSFKNGSFEDTDDSYLAEGWTPNVPVYKLNFDETDFYYPWNESNTNDGTSIFSRTQGYTLGKSDTGEIRGTSGTDSTLKLTYSTAMSDEDAEALMNSATQAVGINNSKTDGFLTVGYELPYYYMIDYYMSEDSEQVLSNQGLYVGLEFRNKADTGFLASVATGEQFMPCVKGKWRTFIGTFTSGTANQINSQTRVNIGIKGMRGTGYMDYFRLIPKGIDTQNPYEGTNSMLVANTLTWTSDVFSVEPGSYYTYYASIRPESDLVEGQITYTFMDNNYGVKGEFIVNTENGEWSKYDENGWKRIEGQVLIPSGATICQITLSNPNESGNVWFDGLVFAKTEEARADLIRITGGNSEVAIPSVGEMQYRYTAVIYDQYSNIMSTDAVWDVKNADGTACNGISITPNGILKISSSATAGEIIVSVSKDLITATKTISVIEKGESKQPESTCEYGFNGSFTANNSTEPFGWTNEDKDVVCYTFDNGIESWKSVNTDYGAPVDGELKWDENINYTNKENSGSLLLYNPSYNMPGAQIPNDVQIEGGMPYKFEMRFKQNNVSDDSLIRTNLRYFNSTNDTIAETPNMLKYYPNDYTSQADVNGWQKWSGSEIVPTNAKTVRIEMRYRGGLNNSDGYAWFDDVKISKLTYLDYDNMYNSNPSLMLVGYDEDSTVTGKEYGERWVSDKLTNISQGVNYEYSAVLQTYNVTSGAYLSFIFYDANGNEISTIKSEKISGTTNGWKELTGSVTAPADTQSVSVAYNLDGKGVSWINGISFDVMSNEAVAGIAINGERSVKIPMSGNNVQNYTVNCVNSSGNVICAADTVIKAINLPSGVSFENGILTVSSLATTGTVKLSAEYDGYSTNLSVTIKKSSSESSGGSGGGGGGSGGSGGGTTVKDVIDSASSNQTINTPMGNVSYGATTSTTLSGSASSTSTPSLLQIPDVSYFTGGNKTIFEDIDGVDWAKESIEALYRAGVVNGKSDNIFAPQDNITRAEFVTMLVKTFKLMSDNNTNTFEDVNDTDWYDEYVNIAVGLGIVNGITDTYFGANENITRQDMAVMCIRLWNYFNKEMSGKYNVSFTDYEQISDYAVAAVTSMAQAGIINGMDTGEFAPHSNATRAQAAVIIYRLAVKYDE